MSFIPFLRIYISVMTVVLSRLRSSIAIQDTIIQRIPIHRTATHRINSCIRRQCRKQQHNYNTLSMAFATHFHSSRSSSLQETDHPQSFIHSFKSPQSYSSFPYSDSHQRLSRLTKSSRLYSVVPDRPAWIVNHKKTETTTTPHRTKATPVSPTATDNSEEPDVLHVEESTKSTAGHIHENSSSSSSTTTTEPTTTIPERINNSPVVTSKPIPGGNWDPHHPLDWCRSFGQRSPEYDILVRQKAQLQPGQEGYHSLSSFVGPSHVTMVTTPQQAQIVLQKLFSTEAQHTYHACDTEVMDIDLNRVGPVGHGYVTCLSMYSGPQFDYGLGDGPGSTLWIDNLDTSFGLLHYFKEWLEDERFKKVWHNYGFDRHVLWNEGINVRGFGADTMHMARLQDTSRFQNGGGYSLESLTEELLGRRKTPMKEIFGVGRLRKDGTAGSLMDIPPVEVLQRDPISREKWIVYSAYDAEGTWKLREKLQELLEKMRWIVPGKTLFDYYVMHMRKFGEVLTDMERRGIRVDAKDYLASVEKQAREDRVYHLAEFRKWAFKMIGPDGLALNPASSTQLCTFLFGGAENMKTKEETPKVRVFTVPREDLSEEALDMYRNLQEEKQGQMKDAAVSGDDNVPVKDELDQMKLDQLKALCKERKLKVSGKKSELIERLREHFQTSQNRKEAEAARDDYDSMTDDELAIACEQIGGRKSTRELMLKHLREDNAYILQLRSTMNDKSSDGYKTISDILASSGGLMSTILSDLKQKKMKESKNIDVTITSIGMNPEKYTDSGAPSVTADVLKSLAGDPFRDPPKYGSAYKFFGGGERGHEASVALYSLTAIGSIDTMIATFLTSLQEVVDHQSRVHCSLNLNTETGRLSSRKPNLQNQPALEKDKYKIRQAFEASPGNNLIVADYGQLELRLLASMTNCRSMIDAFAAGGDFHSRTAMGMFPYIKQQVDDGECLLEWDYSKGEPPKPLLKDKYASERRKAKTLNFSIAYGKTAHGLSQDWGVSIDEAKEMLDAWYRSRPEVLKWQDNTKKLARNHGLTRTLMGRFRQLPSAMGHDRKLKSQAERASINTPIQGGAADIAMMAMIKINDSEILKKLGWILLMQIHDEVILEGPEETAEEAFVEVIKCMEAPWTVGLQPTSVPLLVDGSWNHKNWYDAK